MKNDKDKKIKEPFEPHQTPTPPQIIEPNSERERENPVEAKERTDDRKSPDAREENKAGKNTGKPHLLSEESDIEDETTI